VWFGATMALLGAAIASLFFSLPEIRDFFDVATPRPEESRVAQTQVGSVPPVAQISELSPLASTSQQPVTAPKTKDTPTREVAAPPDTGTALPADTPPAERSPAPQVAPGPEATPSPEHDRPSAPEKAKAKKHESAATGAAPAPLRSGSVVYRDSCAGCHDSGAGNAPSLQDASAWTDRLPRGRDGLYANVMHRHGAIKAWAGNPRPRSEEVRQAVDFMSDRLIAASVARAGKKGYSMHYGPGGTATSPPDVEPPRQQPASQGDWRSELRAELSACEARPDHFQRGVCIEMAHWKHCAPSRWGRDPQCPMPAEPSGTGATR
jgi:cytochrome c5